MRLSYANVASTLALVVALSGTAYAAATITGANVKDNSLSGRDVRNNTLTTKDVKGLTKKDFRAGVLPTAGPGVKIAASGPQTVPNGADNNFEMDTEVFDTGAMYTAPDDFVTIKKAGTYLVSGMVQYNGPASQRQVRIVVDGEVVELSTDLGADSRFTGQVTTLMRLAVGQQVNLGTLSTAAVPVSDFTDQNDVWLAMQWLAP